MEDDEYGNDHDYQDNYDDEHGNNYDDQDNDDDEGHDNDDDDFYSNDDDDDDDDDNVSRIDNGAEESDDVIESRKQPGLNPINKFTQPSQNFLLHLDLTRIFSRLFLIFNLIFEKQKGLIIYF